LRAVTKPGIEQGTQRAGGGCRKQGEANSSPPLLESPDDHLRRQYLPTCRNGGRTHWKLESQAPNGHANW
jgi:hypothetical protein